MTSSAAWSLWLPGYRRCSLSTSASGTLLWCLKYLKYYWKYFSSLKEYFLGDTYFVKPEHFSGWSSTTAEFSCLEYWRHRRHFCPFSMKIFDIWDIKIFATETDWPYLWETCCSCWCSWSPCWWRRPRPCWSGPSWAAPGRRCWSPFGKYTGEHSDCE